MADMKALAERVMALTGPDREVDREIWYALQDEMEGDPCHGPAFTGSLEAAMTLVPEGAKLTFQNHGDTGGRSMWLVSPNERFISAAAPALALTAAALIARSEA